MHVRTCISCDWAPSGLVHQMHTICCLAAGLRECYHLEGTDAALHQGLTACHGKDQQQFWLIWVAPADAALVLVSLVHVAERCLPISSVF